MTQYECVTVCDCAWASEPRAVANAGEQTPQAESLIHRTCVHFVPVTEPHNTTEPSKGVAPAFMDITM